MFARNSRVNRQTTGSRCPHHNQAVSVANTFGSDPAPRESIAKTREFTGVPRFIATSDHYPVANSDHAAADGRAQEAEFIRTPGFPLPPGRRFFGFRHSARPPAGAHRNAPVPGAPFFENRSAAFREKPRQGDTGK